MLQVVLKLDLRIRCELDPTGLLAFAHYFERRKALVRLEAIADQMRARQTGGYAAAFSGGSLAAVIVGYQDS